MAMTRMEQDGLVLTTQGKNLLLRSLISDAQIKFTAISMGNGSDAGYSAAALTNPLLTVELTKFSVDNTFATLTAIFSNSDVSASFRATEIGVMAQDPDNSEQTILYAYSYTKPESSDYINASTDKILETQIDILVYVGAAENVTAELATSMIYASKAELDSHAKDTNNPHNVTAKDIGLGNVEDKAINDQTPTYTVASILAELKSGEKISTALGKIAIAIKSLISHLNDKDNPHKTTAEKIDAADREHSHSTSDINSGTLGIQRGGTGASTAETAREKLGVPAIEHKHKAGDITGVLQIENGGTGVSSMTGTDYTTYRPRGSTIQTSIPSSVPNGCIVFVCNY